MQLSELAGAWNIQVPAYAMAAATTDREDVAIRVPYNMTVTAVYWTPQAAVTANATNYATLKLRNRGSAGTGTVHPATRSYAATDSVAFKPEAATLSSTASDLALTAGDCLSIEMVHTGASGLALPAGTVTILATIR